MKYTVNYTSPISKNEINYRTSKKIGACLLAVLLATFYILSFQYLLNH